MSFSILRPMLIGAAIVASVVTLSAQNDRRTTGGGGILVFEDRDYRGRNATFLDETPNLSATGLERRITSLRVAPGERWEVCTERNYRGRCQVFSGNESDLRADGWSDTIASLRPVRGGNQGRGNAPGGALELFAGSRYSGQRVVITDATDNLNDYRFNDRTLSIRVPRGQEWEVCVNIEYDDCMVVDEDIVDLAPIGMGRNISSVRPRPQDGRFGGGGRGIGRGARGDQPHIVFYEQPNFRGRSLLVNRDTPTLQFFSNAAGSIRVEGGGRWEVCDRPGFGGRCVTITGDVSDLRRLRLNNQISSVRER